MIYLLLASFLWGTSFIAGKFAYETLDPALVVLFRLIIAGGILFPITLRFIKENSQSKVNWRKIALLGFLTYPATFLLQFIGCLLVLASTIVVALWLRLSKSVLGGNLNPKVYTALSLQLGTLIGLPFMLLLVKDWNINFSYSSIIVLLYLGIGCSLFANWTWNKGLSETETNKSGIFLALEPVFGVLFSIILLNDSLSFTSWVGVASVILSATVCLVLPKKN